MLPAPSLFRLLGDETRLRLLRLVARESLNVSEITAVLGVAQSGVSRHLGLLKDAGLVTERRLGTYTWYALNPALTSADDDRTPLWRWLREEFDRATPATREDDTRLEEVRRVRKESFVDHGALADGDRRQLVPGRSWAAWSRALGLLLPHLDVADLGCGEGYLTLETAAWARHVYAIDRSPDVLARARELAQRRKIKNVTWKRGDLDRTPLDDASVDLVLMSHALHHADDPARALAEASRLLRPGGRVLLLDLREHDETWVQTKLGDRWLGFDPEELRDLLTAAGFTDITLRVGAKRAGDPFAVLIGAGRKASDAARRTPGRAPAARKARRT